VQTDIESALIGINHLAERLELSRRTIQRILAKGDLPSLQIGRRRLVRLSELHRWLDGCGGNRKGRTLRKLPEGVT
jgi:excisionase family DNA binding protein